MVVTVHHVGRRQVGPLVHPHVERRIVAKRKTALPRIEMVRRNAQIGQDAVHPFNPVIAQPRVHDAEIAFDECQPGIFGQVRPCIAVLVDRKKAPPRAEPVENPARMTAAAESQVDINPCGPNGKTLKAFIEQNRHMVDTHTGQLEKSVVKV